MASGLVPAIYEGSIEKLLGSVVVEHDLGEVLLVTDPGVTAAGHSVRAREYLEEAGVRVHVYGGVQPNPTNRDVQKTARDHGVERQPIPLVTDAVAIGVARL